MKEINVVFTWISTVIFLIIQVSVIITPHFGGVEYSE